MRAITNRHRFAAPALLLVALAGNALAAPPQILDRVPADAPVVVAVKQVNDFLTDLDQINRLMGDRADNGLVLATSMVRGMPGINLDGEAAFIITPPADPAAGAPTVVAILPVKDFNALTQGRAAENGVVRLILPDNEVYARDLGDGHAVMSDTAEAVRNFEDGKGRLEGHTARIGPAAGRLVNDAEVSIITNAETLRPMLNQGLEGLKETAGFMVMMAGEEAAVAFNSFITMADSVVRDMQAGVFGVTVNEAGMAYDMALQFTEGSPSAAYFAKPGSTDGLLDRLPAQRYVVAAALDASSPTVAKLAETFDSWAKASPEGAQAAGMMKLSDISRLTSGVSFVMGTPAALMGGGVFSATTQYIKTDDPAAYQKAFVDSLKAVDGQSPEGMTMKTTVTADAITIDGTSLTAYGMAVQMNPAAMGGGGIPGMDPAMITQMIFGPAGGPSGYLAQVEGGIVQTMTQGPDLTRRAIAAAKGGNALGANERVRRAAGNLQKNRTAEIHLGIDELLNTVGPTLMMFGAVQNFAPLDPMDPISLGLSIDAGGFNGRIYLPNAAFKAISDFIPQDDFAQPGQPNRNDGFDF